jgi:hypothetical protein
MSLLTSGNGPSRPIAALQTLVAKGGIDGVIGQRACVSARGPNQDRQGGPFTQFDKINSLEGSQ